MSNVLVAIVGGGLALLQTLHFFVLRDLKDRITRLENHLMGNQSGSYNGYERRKVRA